MNQPSRQSHPAAAALALLALLALALAALPAAAARPADAGPPVRFVVAGDSRGGGDGVNAPILAEVVQATLDEHPDFVLVPGDLVNGSADPGTFRSQLSNWRNIVQPLYDAGIGVYPCRGNHDAGNRAVWNSIFSGAYALPANGPAGEENLTYSFSRGNAFVIALDEYANTERVNQSWLEGQLAANSLPAVFVFGHEPAFQVWQTSNLAVHAAARDTFWSSLVAAGVRIYFAGHDHFYQHTRLDDPTGNPDSAVHQFIVGTAGAPFYAWDGSYPGDNGRWTPQPISYEANYGYVVVEVNGLNVTVTWKHRTAPGTYVPGGDVLSYTLAPLPSSHAHLPVVER